MRNSVTTLFECKLQCDLCIARKIMHHSRGAYSPSRNLTIYLDHDQTVVTIFFAFIRCITRLKSSGRRSKPLDGASLVKNTSGPPYANTNDCDSTLADADAIECTEETSYMCEAVRRGMMGKRGAYL